MNPVTYLYQHMYLTNGAFREQHALYKIYCGDYRPILYMKRIKFPLPKIKFLLPTYNTAYVTDFFSVQSTDFTLHLFLFVYLRYVKKQFQLFYFGM